MSTSSWDETRAPPARIGTSDNYHSPPAIDPFRDAATHRLASLAGYEMAMAIASRTKTTYKVISAGGESCAPEISTWGVKRG